MEKIRRSSLSLILFFLLFICACHTEKDFSGKEWVQIVEMYREVIISDSIKFIRYRPGSESYLIMFRDSSLYTVSSDLKLVRNVSESEVLSQDVKNDLQIPLKLMRTLVLLDNMKTRGVESVENRYDEGRFLMTIDNVFTSEECKTMCISNIPTANWAKIDDMWYLSQ